MVQKFLTEYQGYLTVHIIYNHILSNYFDFRMIVLEVYFVFVK